MTVVYSCHDNAKTTGFVMTRIVIQIRATEEEKRVAYANASEAGMTMTDFFLDRCVKRPLNNPTGIGPCPPGLTDIAIPMSAEQKEFIESSAAAARITVNEWMLMKCRVDGPIHPSTFPEGVSSGGDWSPPGENVVIGPLKVNDLSKQNIKINEVRELHGSGGGFYQPEQIGPEGVLDASEYAILHGAEAGQIIDTEVDENGNVVAKRSVEKGETIITTPEHYERIVRKTKKYKVLLSCDICTRKGVSMTERLKCPRCIAIRS